jgi:7,8-dihydropterin-6-yl-methyl-4-(beta-D-ribofuranosyl)aminobenzene 5'-phosphate synthase
MENKIVLLSDNQAGPGMMAEHGLAIWVQTDDRRVLFDTGRSMDFSINADILGLDWWRADTLVLSHGHYDHTTGVAGVIEQISGIHLYSHVSALQPRYVAEVNGAREIHMPDASMVAIAGLPADQVHWVRGDLRLSEHMGVTGPVPRETGYEDPGGAFFLDPECMRPDIIEDDQAMWINTESGLIVCVGCSHAGIVNTLNYACWVSGQTNIRAVIGGFHLINADDRRLAMTIAALQELSPELVIPCHCTGARAVQALRAALGDRVCPGRSGMAYTFND